MYFEKKKKLLIKEFDIIWLFSLIQFIVFMQISA